MRNLILPAETLSREFDARVLQALIAVGRGWNVVVGSKAHINRNIWRFPRGVYLCQTLTPKRLTMLKYLKALGFASVGWCEEGFVYPGKDLYIKRRIAEQSLEFLTALIAWGENNSEDLNVKAEKIGLHPVALGNPRIDLLRPEFRDLYREDVDDLKNRYGDYLLFNSNFASVNPAPEVRAGGFRKHADPEVARRFDEWIEYRRQIFEKFHEVLPTLADHFSDRTIVIRPHPSEDPEFWQELAGRHRNIEVVRENTAIPWLIAAGATLHNGCTTAAEGALLGKTPISYCPILVPRLEHLLSNEISIKATTPEELISTVQDCFDQKLSLGPEQQSRLDFFAASRTGDLASVRIQNLFDEVSEQKSMNGVSGVEASLTRGLAFARYCYKSLRVGHRTDRYIPTVFPPIDVAYVQQRSRAIASCLGMQNSYQIGEVSKNIFRFAPN